MTTDEIRQRIFDSLSKGCQLSKKEFWRGFILALIDAGIITHLEWIYLTATINAWRAGDTASRMTQTQNRSDLQSVAE